jgi:hypothetical protein
MPYLRLLLLLLVATAWASLSTAAELNKASFEGLVFLQGTGKVPYVLTINYVRSEAPSLPFRKISNINLTLAGKKIVFPPRSFQDLWHAHRPWPLYTHGVEPHLAMFMIEGGDASKSYEVRYIVSKDRLVRREFKRHLAKQSEVVIFENSE